MGVPLAGRAILARRPRRAHRALLTQVSSLRVTVPNAIPIKLQVIMWQEIQCMAQRNYSRLEFFFLNF